MITHNQSDLPETRTETRTSKEFPYQHWEKAPNALALSKQLDKLPPGWVFTPLWDKKPFRDNWQDEEPVSRDEIRKMALSGFTRFSQKKQKNYKAYISGIGLRTGDVSGGLLCPDFDGLSSLPLWESLRGDNPEPHTVSWTSGKTGRKQIALQVPDEYRARLKNFTRVSLTELNGLKTELGEDGKSEQLEFRYNSCQSVIPPSLHPETGSYKWINSPLTTEVALAPEWLLDFVVALAEQQEIESQKKLASQANYQHKSTGNTDLDRVKDEVLTRLGTGAYDWPGHNFHLCKNRLEGCCPNHQSQSGRSFHVSRETLKWHCFGCQVGGHILEYKQFVKTGKTDIPKDEFIPLLKELAIEAGVDFPELKIDKVIWDGERALEQARKSVEEQKKMDAKTEQKKAEPKKYTTKQINELLDKWVGQNLDESTLLGYLSSLASESRKTVQTLEKMYLARKKAIEDKEALDDTKTALDSLLTASNEGFDLSKAYPESVAKAFQHWSDEKRFDPLFLHSNFMPALAQQIGASIYIDLGAGWTEWLIFWSIAVALPSSGKSVSQSAIYEPIEKLQNEQRREYKRRKKELKIVEQKWSLLNKEEKQEKIDSDDNPDVFQEKYLNIDYQLFDNGTTEALLSRMSEKESYSSICWNKDELSGLFGADQYKSKTTDTRQTLLTSWNKPYSGDVQRRNIGDSYNIFDIALQINGGIQNKKLSSLFDTTNDVDGFTSRALFSLLKRHPGFTNPPIIDVSLYPMLNDIYSRSRSIRDKCLKDEDGYIIPMRSRFTESARARWLKVQRQYRERIVKYQDSNPCLSETIGKHLSYIARLALLLHCLVYCIGEAKELGKIDEQDINRAIYISGFHIRQFILCQNLISGSEQPLNGQLADLLTRAKAAGSISARDLYTGFARRWVVEGKEMDSTIALSLLQQLTELGYGTLTGKTFIPKNDDKNDDKNIESVIIFEKTDYGSTSSPISDLAVEQNVNDVNDDKMMTDSKTLEHIPNIESNHFRDQNDDKLKNFSDEVYTDVLPTNDGYHPLVEETKKGFTEICHQIEKKNGSDATPASDTGTLEAVIRLSSLTSLGSDENDSEVNAVSDTAFMAKTKNDDKETKNDDKETKNDDKETKNDDKETKNEEQQQEKPELTKELMRIAERLDYGRLEYIKYAHTESEVKAAAAAVKDGTQHGSETYRTLVAMFKKLKAKEYKG